MLSNPESNTLSEMLLSGYRLDGRTLTEYRQINFRFPQGSTSHGCCVVKIGSTTVMAQVSYEVVEPKHFRPSQGCLYVNFDASLLNMNKTFFRKQKRNDEGRRLSAVLQTLLRDSVDLDALCIVAWERVFAIRVELRALSYDGNLGDCGALAAVAALGSFRRPDVFLDDSGKVIVDVEAKFRPKVPLNIKRLPVLITLGLDADAKVIVIDPSAREEHILLGGRVMLGLTCFSEICCLYTTGLTVPIQSKSLLKCINMATEKAQRLVALLNEVMDGLSAQRNARLTSCHGRSSELNKITNIPVNAPLVLSTFSYILKDTEKNAALDTNNKLEGELSPVSEDMSIESDDAEKEATTNDKPIPCSQKFQPYGVIEIPTVSDSYDAEPLHFVDFLNDFDTTTNLMMTAIEPKTENLLKSEIKYVNHDENYTTTVHFK